jgi:hypothetical protein
VQVGSQFIRRARFARIAARHCQPAAEAFARGFESADIITLPAVQRDGNLGQLSKRLVYTDA